MANTLTNLIPDFYAALDVVNRELVGFIPSVARNSTADQTAQNQTLRIPITPANAAGKNITPAMSLPAASDQTIGNVSLTIAKYRAFPFSWSGEEVKSVTTGPGFLSLQQGQIAQAIRAAINEMEADVAAAAYKAASRAYGTAGTTPFATGGDYSDAAQTRKILDDNGAPPSDRTLIVNTAGGANIRAKQAQAYMAGDNTLQRQGIIFDINGFAIRESAQVPTVTKGTGASYTTTAAGFAVGTTSIPIITGTGTVLAGDVVTFAGDTNKYVVTTGVAAPGTIVIAAPGLRQAIPASATAMTVGNSFSANVAFTRNAILLATRLPAVPPSGDLARDRMTITDPVSGISLGLAYYPGYMMGEYEIQLAWGVSVIKPEHVAILLG